MFKQTQFERMRHLPSSQKNIEARKQTRERSAQLSRQAILEAALIEFSANGFAGARVDDIAKRAGVSKPLLYGYFGDKNAVYSAALREAYVQIRSAERLLNLSQQPPTQAIRSLIEFTLKHYRENPWFIAMLNTENLRGGAAIRDIQDATDIQTPLIKQLADILQRGHADGVFRGGVDPTEFYIHIAGLCYFPISNEHTLRAVFGVPLDQEWLDQHGQSIGDMAMAFLAPKPISS